MWALLPSRLSWYFHWLHAVTDGRKFECDSAKWLRNIWRCCSHSGIVKRAISDTKCVFSRSLLMLCKVGEFFLYIAISLQKHKNCSETNDEGFFYSLSSSLGLLKNACTCMELFLYSISTKEKGVRSILKTISKVNLSRLVPSTTSCVWLKIPERW